ncbi:isoprenoid synthase domain-containing protein [Aspergillus californicus]
MGLIENILYYAFHPIQLRNILQWKIYHKPIYGHTITDTTTETQRTCFRFLDQTGRSFSAVIKELHPDLLLPVCVFYLVLRGLDTIEDDPSIPVETKEGLLRDFKDTIEEDGWIYEGNRLEEQDRELLVQFHCVIGEYKKLKPGFRNIIKDVADNMGNGMADYCRKAHSGDFGIATVVEYDLYCFYVAGLVGEGLTRLFAEVDRSPPSVLLLESPQLHKAMGLFLQKTNIIRDVYQDYHDNRRFWPREIWSKHVNDFDYLFKYEYRDAALNCSSEMVLNALQHVEDCLMYLDGLHEQSVFNFCAVPQGMAIATLELCFRNPAIFEQSIKITKGDACRLMIESTQDLQVLCGTFRRYARRVQRKNTPKDPNYTKISMVCSRIEKFTLQTWNGQDVGAGKQMRQNVYLMVALTSVIILIISLFMSFGVLTRNIRDREL